MKILGINAFHPDSSACIVVDGKVVVAIEEERLVRVKHWAGYPSKSIQACLDEAGLLIDDIDCIAINRNPNVHLAEKLLFALKSRPSLRNIVSRIQNRKEIGNIPGLLAEQLSSDKTQIEKKIIRVEHHVAHMASTYFTAPFEEAVVLSIDGFGDFVSTMWGHGHDLEIEIGDYVGFPHSLGLLYTAFTQYIGFGKYGDEYKVMGMAAYGKPSYLNEVRNTVKPTEGGKFELNFDYFLHQSEGVTMEFSGGYPEIGQVYSDQFIKLLGKAREPNDEVTQKHKDIACSLQVVYEEILFHILDHLNEIYPNVRELCLSGGCAQNSVANGKITSRTNFDNVWVQPAAGDAGGALGAAIMVSGTNNSKRISPMISPALGLRYTNSEIADTLSVIGNDTGYSISYYSEEDDLVEGVCDLLCLGNVIGFFHGAFEWGPRALGNRSIIVDPRISDMKDLLNKKIKKRESFRPFAPSVLREDVSSWFEINEDVPFMTHVFMIKIDKRALIPAVTHVDGSGRLQSVTKEFNTRYYDIINRFKEKTGIPMILNTSFNENEPIVNSPQEALDCFLRTQMDVLVLENYIVKRK